MLHCTLCSVDILLFNWWQHFSLGWLGFDFIEGIPVILVISIILVGNVTVNIIKRKLQPLQQLYGFSNHRVQTFERHFWNGRVEKVRTNLTLFRILILECLTYRDDLVGFSSASALFPE